MIAKTASSAGGIGRKKNDSFFFSLVVVVTQRGEELEREEVRERERKKDMSLFFLWLRTVSYNSNQQNAFFTQRLVEQ